MHRIDNAQCGRRPVVRMLAARVRGQVVVGLCLATILAGCYGDSSSPTPGDMVAVQGELQAHGVTITDDVAGDPGCPDQRLFANARRLQLTLAADGKTYQAYLFRWLNQADYTAAASSFSMCVSTFAARGSSVDVETIEVSPWRAYGPDWSKQMHDALQGSLAAAATGQ